MPSIKLNSLSNLVRFIINIAIGLLLTPFIINSLGKNGYGVWVLIGSFVGYYGLLNLGLDAAIRRYISIYTAQNKSNDLNKVASTALVMFSCTGLTVMTLSVVFSGDIADFFNVSPADHKDFTQLVEIMGITIGLGFPAGVFSAIVTAREHFIAINIMGIVNQIIRSILTVLFLINGFGLVGLGMATLIGVIFLLGANFFIFKWYANDIKLKVTNFSRPTLRIMLAFGVSAFIISVGDILRLQIDSFIIGKYVSLEMVGVYGLAMLLVRYLISGVVSVMGTVAPRFAFLHGDDNQVALRSLFFKSLSASAIVSSLFTFLLLLCADAFIRLWVGDGFKSATAVIWILSLSYLFDLVQNPSISLMYAKNKHHIYALLTISEGVLNLLLSLALVSDHGIIGVALGTALSTIVVRIIIQPIIVSKLAEISLFKYVGTMLPAFLVFFTLLAFLIYFNQEINSLLYSYVNLVIACLFSSVIYIFGVMMFSRQLRESMVSFFSSRRRLL